MSRPFSSPARRDVVVGFALASLPATATGSAAPDTALEALVRSAPSPGVAAASIDPDGRARFHVYGSADIAAARPVSIDTVFHAASVSKVVAGAALVRAHEAGLIGLDDPVDQFVDFPLRNPRHPDRPITFRQLYTHTSSISDGAYGPTLYGAGDPKQPLGEFLRSYLAPGGKLHALDRCFLPDAPGARWSYSNVGIALAAHAAERVTGHFAEYCRQSLFRPARMRSASWRIADVPPISLATPYAARTTPERPATPLSQVGYPDWPAGMLRASVRDLAAFVAVFLREGRAWDGARVLSRSWFDAMTRPTAYPGLSTSLTGQSLFWRHGAMGQRPIMSHTGADPGATTGVFLDLDRRRGAVVLMNVSPSEASRAYRTRLAETLLGLSGAQPANARG